MRLLGLDISRASAPAAPVEKTIQPIGGSWRGGWLSVFEPYAGAWQQNVSIDRNLVLAYHAVYASITLIASDIAKLRLRLVARDADGIWSEVRNPAYDPIVRKPNTYQNRIQFWEYWLLSKLTTGNTYVLKSRDLRGVVNRLSILDPRRVTPLIADDGSIFYELMGDALDVEIGQTVRVPQREIIHDRFNCVFHPLIGTSPIIAAGLAATQGLKIQTNSAKFFENKSMPGGILTAPGIISNETAGRLKASWEANYGQENFGRVAVLGDGLKFEPIAITAEDAQLIEQLRWTAEVVCSVFHVPPYKIGVGQMPTYNNIQSLNVEYYSQCLQRLIEDAELCLDEGLEMAPDIGTEFDLDGLLRMDSVTQMQVAKEGIGAGVFSPNEARRKHDLKPVKGGWTPYLQQQNYSLAALAKRDAQEDPFGRPKAAPPAPAEPEEEEVEARGFVYRGVHEEGQSYRRGDFVTSGGSMWHCNGSTTASPGENGDWTLAVKRGRDGRDGK